MACFLAPLAEAVVVSVMKKSFKFTSGNEFVKKSGWLTNLLYGGSFLLAVEHVWHGEVVPWFPFLTAVKNPEDIKSMLHEIATTGVSMAVTVTAVWIVMVLVSSVIERRKTELPAAEKA
jgi:hypothetical protein